MMDLKSLKIRAFFAWYGLWVGVYVDRENQAVYICLLPTLVIKIWKPKPKEIKFTDILIELNAAYIGLAQKRIRLARIAASQMEMFGEWSA